MRKKPRKPRRTPNRDYNTPEYKRWRAAVFSRDRRKCKMPGCCSSYRVQAHHIRTWASSPDLRFQVSNGITLCYSCHQKISGREREYEAIFQNILHPAYSAEIYKIRKGLG